MSFVVARSVGRGLAPAVTVAIYCVSLVFEIATPACALVRNDNEAL